MATSRKTGDPGASLPHPGPNSGMQGVSKAIHDPHGEEVPWPAAVVSLVVSATKEVVTFAWWSMLLSPELLVGVVGWPLGMDGVAFPVLE